MPKFSNLFKASLTITLFFAIDKIVALIRQGIIVKQFGLSAEIDAFNIANNLPDLLATLISGGAFAVALIPILSEYLHKRTLEETWLLFSRVANLVFLTTAILSIIVALFAEPIVQSEIGIAPGFSTAQQGLVVKLMRLNLLGTLLFSLSGLMISALQAKKHFLLPALAPTLYNLGQIFGATILARNFGLGIYGLVYGVLLGALFHMAIQIPGIIRYRIRWSFSLNFTDAGVRKVLILMGPRILTVLFIQIIFLMRDNFASRLHEGAVTALTYGYFIMQVPETLIGTAIATALLPTLSQLAHHEDKHDFSETINRAIRVIFSLTILITILSILGLESFVRLLFHFSANQVQLLVWTTAAYMGGLTSMCLLEVITRSYYARQDAKTPLTFTALRMILFVILALTFYSTFGVVGIALIDSLTVTFEVLALALLLDRRAPIFYQLRETLLHTLLASFVVTIVFFLTSAATPLPGVYGTLSALILATLTGIVIIRKELLMLVRL